MSRASTATIGARTAKRAALASRPVAARAAESALAQGGSAVDAVFAAFLADGGERAEVLLAPACLIALGTGVGAKAYDGRALQPGRGAPRPRGFTSPGSVPAAARAAVPRSLSLITLAHAHYGRLGLGTLVGFGTKIATAAGDKARARLLSHFAGLGASCLLRDDVFAAIDRHAGPNAAGLITRDDLDASLAREVTIPPTPLGKVSGALLPWMHEGDPREAAPADFALAIDAWGMIAALSYVAEEAPIVEGLGISLPRGAIPVMRGVTRIPAGTILTNDFPIGVVLRGEDMSVACASGTRLNEADWKLIATKTPVDDALHKLERGHHVAALVSQASGVRAIAAATEVTSKPSVRAKSNDENDLADGEPTSNEPDTSTKPPIERAPRTAKRAPRAARTSGAVVKKRGSRARSDA